MLQFFQKKLSESINKHTVKLNSKQIKLFKKNVDILQNLWMEFFSSFFLLDLKFMILHHFAHLFELDDYDKAFIIDPGTSKKTLTSLLSVVMTAHLLPDLFELFVIK